MDPTGSQRLSTFALPKLLRPAVAARLARPRLLLTKLHWGGGLAQEKELLEAELARMPAGSGRTQQERRRKAGGEARLEELRAEMAAARSLLRQHGMP